VKNLRNPTLAKKGALWLYMALLISVAMTMPIRAQTTKLSVIPKNNVFYTNTTSINSTFIINITVFNVIDLYNWQVTLLWNASLLEETNAWLPSDNVFAGKNFFSPPPFVNNTEGSALLGAMLVYPEPYGVNVTEGRLSQIEFKIIAEPAFPNSSVSTSLRFSNPGPLGDTFLLNHNNNDISFTAEDGYYEYTKSEVIHDITIVSVTTSATDVILGEKVTITVVAKNNGSETEAFNVTVYYNNSIAGPAQIVTSLLPGGSKTLDFRWDTANVSPGIYTIRVNATIVEGETETADNEKSGGTVIVNKLQGTVSININPTSIKVGESTIISGSIIPLREGALVTIKYRLGGGTWSTLETVTTDENSQYSYAWTPETVGTYEVKASWPGDENTTQDESDVETLYLKAPPTASFAYTPPAPTVGETVTFTSNSTDPNGFIVSRNWDFGDGTVGSGDTVTHTYATSGDFTVNLTVTDNDGLTYTTTKSITVNQAPAGIPVYPIIAIGAIIIAGCFIAYLIRKKR
jgi:hypothetical protein